MGEAGTWDALHDAMDGALCRIEARPRPSKKKRPYSSVDE